jgi:hypothetical protein|tara:strand:+ start:1654 stop:1908 length:255 start_codon:yes stop_codon:yes gene_type:complete
MIMNPVSNFNRRIEVTPDEWRQVLVDVMDTFDSVSLYFEQDDKAKFYSPELALGLTRLVIERHDAEQERLEKEETEFYNNQTNA